MDAGRVTNEYFIKKCVYSEMTGAVKPAVNQVWYIGEWKLVC
jgi:hypothetical protein